MTIEKAVQILEEYIEVHETEEYTDIVKGEVEAIKTLLEAVCTCNGDTCEIPFEEE